MTRRESLKVAAAAALTACYEKTAASPRAPPLSPSAPPDAARGDEVRPSDRGRGTPLLWYRQPATRWVEALPIGSGRLGAMVFGGVATEQLALNEDTLWGGGPYTPDNPEALAALPEIRRLIFDRKYREAHDVAKARMMAHPLRQMPYQTPGDLLLSFPQLDPFQDYRRELRLDTAVARTTFRSLGATFVREAFASAVDQVIALRLTADRPGLIGFDMSMRSPQQTTVEFRARAVQAQSDGDALVMHGKNAPSDGIDGALRFEVRAKVLAVGGSTGARGEQLSVREADSVLVLLTAATSYKSFRDVSADPTAITTQRIAAAERKGYQGLLADHIAEHRRLFDRVAIDLGSSEAADRPTDERVEHSAELDDPDLAALYFQFGRYLLISSSRPGGQAANLQGLWNDSLTPPWGCKYTININTEMNYWPAESTHLAECVEPLTALVSDLTETGARTARAQYGARGWVAHHNTDLWRAAAPIDGPEWGLWPTGGAWLCMTLWDHYDYGRDVDYLGRIYPILKGAAEFFLDTLVEEPQKKWLVTCPSLSPENVHPGGTSLCAGPTMDQQILRDLFAHCVEAARTLGVDQPLCDRLLATSARLAPNQIGRGGQLQEWLDDWDLEAPEPHHRHVSHLYGLFPSDQIGLRSTPELAAAARKSLELRGDEATGWGIAWRLNLWARLEEGDHAHGVLRQLLHPQRTYPNLFDAHPPFQIDGNFGGVSGIVEMLMQSHSGVIHLLPGLPKAWPSGRVQGLRARRGFGVDLQWRGGRLDAATIRGRPGSSTPLLYRGQEITLRLNESGQARVTLEGAALRAE